MADLRILADDHDMTIGEDLDEGIGHERVVGDRLAHGVQCGVQRAHVGAQQQAAAGDGGDPKEGAAVDVVWCGHGRDPHSLLPFVQIGRAHV